MKKLLLRSFFVLFWIALIGAILYWPKLKVIQYDSRTLNVFAWGDILDPSVIAKFEKETNIKVRLSYYASNEELLVKLKATQGEGYDLIVPSDYAVKILIQENLLKCLDKSRLHFWKELNPHLLGHFFDPENRYSLPFEWEVYLFGINKDYFDANPKLPPSWKLIFDRKTVQYKISMTNDPIEAIQFAGFYLFGNVSELNSQQALSLIHI